MTMPGQPDPEFSLTTSLTPRGRPNMAAFMEVNSDPRSKDYGTIAILQLPQDTAIAGPAQVQNDFESDPPASIELTQLRKGGSMVTEGNLITLPVAGGLMYFEPVYVSASAAGTTGAYPELKRVFVYYEGQVGYQPTLQAALAQALGASAGQSGTGGSPPAGGHGAPASATVLKYLQQAEAYYSQAQAALRSGSLPAYADAIAKMKAALDSAQKAAQGTPAAKPGPAASPSPSASP